MFRLNRPLRRFRTSDRKIDLVRPSATLVSVIK